MRPAKIKVKGAKTNCSTWEEENKFPMVFNKKKKPKIFNNKLTCRTVKYSRIKLPLINKIKMRRKLMPNAILSN
jgi:hypothetical protein